MNLPAITGVIRRRILLNYRVAPEAVARILPANFRPQLVEGFAIAGICLIRLEAIRPKGLPSFLGISSENSAHRIAVEWDDATGLRREGVFITRRDTDSRINAFAGGRLFPGVHHHSQFRVHDGEGRLSIRVEATDPASTLVEIDAEETDVFPKLSVFSSLSESSRFFEAGCLGYSSRPDSCVLDGLSLKVPQWRVTPLAVRQVRSAFFDDRELFPEDQIQFDHALLMRDVPHEWHSEPEMIATPTTRLEK